MLLLSPLTLPWDLAIALTIVFTAVVAVLAFRRARMPSAPRWKRFTLGCLSMLSAIGLLFILYGSFVEPQIIVVTREEVTIGLTDPITVAVVSDFHIGPYKGKRFVERAVKRINDLRPDMVLIAGDFVLDEEVDADGLTPLEPLKNLQSLYGTFAVAGNHDHGVFRYFEFLHIVRHDHSDQVAEFLQSLGITILQNENMDVRVGADIVNLAGVDDVWSGVADIVKTMTGSQHPSILLTHNPDIILDPASDTADLIIAGHTHGGQIRLPWYGPIPKLPTRIGRKYDQGIFALPSNNTLAITRGIGESGPRMRLFAPPEILLLTVR